MSLKIDNAVSANEGGNNTMTYHAIKPGLYIARIHNIEIKESKKWQSEEMEKKLVFDFALIKNAMSKKDVEDVEGESFMPLRRRVWKWSNPKLRYAFGGEIKNTQSGDVVAAAGVDITADEVDVEEAIGKVLVVKVDSKKKGDGTLKDVIVDATPFEGDMKEVEAWIKEAEELMAQENESRDMHKGKEVEDLPWEDGEKK